jgi:sugar porter (SP) family MFS transporter
MAGISAASLGVIFGYDASTIAASLRYITDDFNLSTPQQEIVTTTVIIGQIVGAIGGALLANAIGRKKSMVLVAAGYAVFAVFGAVAVSLPTLLVARLLLGVTIGVSVVVVPVFIAESAPARVRGSLLVAYELTTAAGIVVGYLVAYLLAGSHSWRWMLGLAAVPSVLIMLSLLPIPETARWYMLKGRAVQARRALLYVEPEADVEAELAEIAHTIEEERGGVFVEILQRRYLRATVFAVGLGLFVQITGINAIIYYGPLLFEAMGFTGDFALFVLPALVKVAALPAVVVALILVDRVGRRPTLLSGIVMMIVADAVLVGAFALRSDFPGALSVFGFVGVLLFTVGFSFGFGSLVGVYAGEILPARLRSMGSSLMLTSDLVASAAITAVFLTMLHSLGGGGTFTVFGALALAAFVFVYRFAPETKGRQLEDLRHFGETRDTRHVEQTSAVDAASSLTASSRFAAQYHGGG